MKDFWKLQIILKKALMRKVQNMKLIIGKTLPIILIQIILISRNRNSIYLLKDKLIIKGENAWIQALKAMKPGVFLRIIGWE